MPLSPRHTVLVLGLLRLAAARAEASMKREPINSESYVYATQCAKDAHEAYAIVLSNCQPPDSARPAYLRT